MKTATELALYHSIEKWKGVVAGTVKEQGWANCALCARFNANGAGNCIRPKTGEKCPVYARTGQDTCYGSPYEDYINTSDEDEKLECAKRELEFLQSLLPPWDPMER